MVNAFSEQKNCTDTYPSVLAPVQLFRRPGIRKFVTIVTFHNTLTEDALIATKS